MKFKATEIVLAALLALSIGGNVLLSWGARQTTQLVYELTTSAMIVGLARKVDKDRDVIVTLERGDALEAQRQLVTNIDEKIKELRAYAENPNTSEYIRGLAQRYLSELEGETQE